MVIEGRSGVSENRATRRARMIDASAYRTEWARTIKGGSLEQFRLLPRPSYKWVFDITVRDGKVAHIQECIDTQVLARASQMDASGLSTLTTQYPAMRIDASFDDRLTDLVDTGLDAVVRIGEQREWRMTRRLTQLGNSHRSRMAARSNER